MSETAPVIGIDDSLLGGFTRDERVRIRAGENFALWGWTEIARAIQRASRKAALRLAERAVDPLLVEWEGDRPFVRAWNVIAWRQNQRQPHKYRRRSLRVLQGTEGGR